MKKKTNKEFLKEVYSLVKNEYTPLEEYINYSTKILMKHNLCNNSYKVAPNNFIKGHRCPYCYGKNKKTNEEVNKEIKLVLGNDYELNSDYINNHTKMKIIHKPCNNISEVSLTHLKDFKGCIYCNGSRTILNNETFKKKVELKYNDEYIPLSDYKSIHEKVLMKHNKCGYEWLITPNNFLNNNRKCPLCSGVKKKTHEEFINEVFDLVGDEYTVLSEYKSCRTKILMKHNKCNCEWYIRPNDFLNNKRCPNCNLLNNESKAVKEIKKYLDDNNIKYIQEKRFKTCKDKNTLPFDFYLIDYDLLIEYDGEQHFNKATGSYIFTEEKVSLIKSHDQIKDQWCKENNKELLRINYKQNHLKILKNYLKKKLN